MAWMNQEKKSKIAAELKKVMPKDWKYSLSVHNHSTIVLTIIAAPVDLVAACKYQNKDNGHVGINNYYLQDAFDGELLEIFSKAKDALNIDNFDNSDIATDYFHVGHYVDMKIGKWNKPFQVIAK